jgi:hypothetical protein
MYSDTPCDVVVLSEYEKGSEQIWFAESVEIHLLLLYDLVTSLDSVLPYGTIDASDS